MVRCLLPFVLFANSAWSAVLEVELKAGRSTPVTLSSPVDDTNFQDPPGYAFPGARLRSFTQRIELTNTGNKPLVGRLLTVNERDYTNVEGFERSLGLSGEAEHQARTIEKLFTFWKDHRSHAGTGSPLANEPFATLNFWGYTLCGEDTQSLARLAHAFNIPARFVQLNGHLAAEYQYGGDWHVVDGDQNAVYLRLDNRTLASAADIRADPFLVLRTKVFGKHSGHDFAHSAFNCALIEHVSPTEPKPLKLKLGPAPLNTFSVRPGEMIVWHPGLPPESPVAQLDSAKPDALRAAALATVEHRALAKHYERTDGRISIPSPFPIWKAVNRTTGETVTPKPREVVFKITVPIDAETDEISIFAQCSRLALPLLTRGENMVKLEAANGTAKLAVHYELAQDTTAPGARVLARQVVSTGPPAFTLASTARPERVWWQISTRRDFSFVPPSLEGVQPWTSEFRLDPVADTFLNPGEKYWIRIKARSSKLWGGWSDAVPFSVSKPAAPTAPRFEKVGAATVRLAWEHPDRNASFRIYASNRRDFVPEFFTDSEIVAMDHLKVTEQRENNNLLVGTAEPAAEFVPKHRFYRIIASKDAAHSVPSTLIELPAELSDDLPPAKILQVRAAKLGDKDVYRATELPLIPPRPEKQPPPH